MQDKLLTLSLPLAIELTKLPELPTIAQLTAIDTENEHIITTIISLQTHLPQTGDQDMDKALLQIDNKLNLLLSLVSRLDSQQVPPQSRLGLSANTLYLPRQNDLETGQLLQCQVYLQDNIHLPLTLYGELELNLDSELSQWPWKLSFAEYLDKSLETLERYIFLQHRRELALSRHTQD